MTIISETEYINYSRFNNSEVLYLENEINEVKNGIGKLKAENVHLKNQLALTFSGLRSSKRIGELTFNPYNRSGYLSC